MRLRQEKVHDLARQLTELLRSHPKVHPLTSENALRVAIAGVFLEDLREEEEIEREAEALLAQHDEAIEKEGLDRETLRWKFKREIAKRRGFQL